MKLKYALSSLAIIIFSLLTPISAAAQTPSSGLSISPTNNEFTLHPGDTKTLTLTIKDITSGSVIAQGSVVDFTSDNISGNPKILSDTDPPSPNSIKSFISGLVDTPLNSGEQKNINVLINVPANLMPGAYYGILRFKALPAGNNAPKSNEVSLTASVGSIVLVTVPGNLREQAQLKVVHVYRNNREGTIFLGAPDQVGIELKNLGNSFIKPFGNVQIKDMAGKIVYSYQLNNTKQAENILPNSSRTFIDSIKNIKGPGRYTVTASVAYGDGSNVLALQKNFWYLPRWFAYAFLVLLVAVFALVYWLMHHRRHHHYRKHR